MSSLAGLFTLGLVADATRGQQIAHGILHPRHIYQFLGMSLLPPLPPTTAHLFG
ncbi:MAG: hypothetical protein IJ604_13160 [Prevotella sp.]|nr:hypothetical protein [Prevotella sp.]